MKWSKLSFASRAHLYHSLNASLSCLGNWRKRREKRLLHLQLVIVVLGELPSILFLLQKCFNPPAGGSTHITRHQTPRSRHSTLLHRRPMSWLCYYRTAGRRKDLQKGNAWVVCLEAYHIVTAKNAFPAENAVIAVAQSEVLNMFMWKYGMA